ncbi:hypothetical protein EVG20_g10777 [Dentipellis fragilis]|uniref:Uncharacterized protein n=1 Tax=Dentipellis fragilis TaxID=205917 RepID=A0A4Y9XRB9_9AGAM|nr:hypothetical protein EVG20_g10777 [Dentipellis fragilis]
MRAGNPEPLANRHPPPVLVSRFDARGRPPISVQAEARPWPRSKLEARCIKPIAATRETTRPRPAREARRPIESPKPPRGQARAMGSRAAGVQGEESLRALEWTAPLAAGRGVCVWQRGPHRMRKWPVMGGLVLFVGGEREPLFRIEGAAWVSPSGLRPKARVRAAHISMQCLC